MTANDLLTYSRRDTCLSHRRTLPHSVVKLLRKLDNTCYESVVPSRGGGEPSSGTERPIEQRRHAAVRLSHAGLQLAVTLLQLPDPGPLLDDPANHRQRIGIADAIDAIASGQKIPLSLLDGPVLIRADQANLTLVTSARSLVIVENLQAAETLAQQPALQALAIVYLAGQPSPAARRHIAALSSQVVGTLLCLDADLGGVRIANAILSELPAASAETVTVSDAGVWPHKPQPYWPADGVTVTGLTRALDSPAGNSPARASAAATGSNRRKHP